MAALRSGFFARTSFRVTASTSVSDNSIRKVNRPWIF